MVVNAFRGVAYFVSVRHPQCHHSVLVLGLFRCPTLQRRESSRLHRNFCKLHVLVRFKLPFTQLFFVAISWIEHLVVLAIKCGYSCNSTFKRAVPLKVLYKLQSNRVARKSISAVTLYLVAALLSSTSNWSRGLLSMTRCVEDHQLIELTFFELFFVPICRIVNQVQRPMKILNSAFKTSMPRKILEATLTKKWIYSTETSKWYILQATL